MLPVSQLFSPLIYSSIGRKQLEPFKCLAEKCLTWGQLTEAWAWRTQKEHVRKTHLGQVLRTKRPLQGHWEPMLLLVWPELESRTREVSLAGSWNPACSGQAGMTEEEGIIIPGLLLCAGLLPGSPCRE